MRIKIKEIDDDKDYYKNLNFIGKQIFDFKLDFVKMRLSVLKEDLIIEESNNPKACVRLIMNGETVNDFTEIRGYSKKMSDKIKDCLCRETVYFEDRIYEIVNAALN